MDPRLEEVLRLAQRGAKLEALRVLRSLTGMSLEQAEEALAKLAKPQSSGELSAHLLDLLRQRVQHGEAQRPAPPQARASATPAPPRSQPTGETAQGPAPAPVERPSAASPWAAAADRAPLPARPLKLGSNRTTHNSETRRTHRPERHARTAHIRPPFLGVLAVTLAMVVLGVLFVALLVLRLT